MMKFPKIHILSSKLVKIIILSLLIFWLGNWFFTHFERVSETIITGYQGKARSNPLLAAEYLLARMGAKVLATNTVPTLKELDRTDTLLLNQTDTSLSKVQIGALFTWVTAGGHLIFVSESLWDAKDSAPLDPLLASLRVYQYDNELGDEEIEQALPTPVTWQEYSLQVAFSPKYRLEGPHDFIHNPLLEMSDEYGIHLLTYPVGQGMMTVLSDLWFIENDAIGKYDHAQFLWHLVNFKRPVTRIWLVQPRSLQRSSAGEAKEQFPTLWQLLWLNAWMVILSATTLLLGWLWLASRRFGPLFPEPSFVRRRLLEHIDASGHFVWQQGQSSELLNATRQALMTRLKAVHPDWARLSNQEVSERLAQLSGWSEREIEETLSVPVASSTSSAGTPAKLRWPFYRRTRQVAREQEFTHAVQILTYLRNRL